MIPPGNGLSTPRINRLLRPLRNKCTALASESSSAPFMHATYFNNRTGWSRQDSPPLALLQPPGNVGIRVHLDDDYMRTVELARRLYAVRDCFKNVLQVAFGVDAEQPARRSGKDIPTLGAMCSIVIGTTIQVQFDENAVAKAEGDDDYMEEEEVMALANEIYEAVPLHYRRCLLLLFPICCLLDSIMQMDNRFPIPVHDFEHMSPSPHAFDCPAGCLPRVESLP
jgi:hypothetical protein